MIDGVDYAIDVTQPARYDDLGALVAPEARRIRDLTFKGAPVDPNQSFLVVTNNYRASGGGGFPGCDGTSVVIEAPDANRDVRPQISSRAETKSRRNRTAPGALRPGQAPWLRPSDVACRVELPRRPA